MSLATKLKKLRVEKKTSLQQVADAVGVSKAHIWELERGTSANPGVDLLQKLANHFDVTVAFLTDGSFSANDAAAVQFFREIEGLSNADLKVLRDMAARLKGKP